jgi:hypothetical protein
MKYSPINFDAMRVKIEFLFRLVDALSVHYNREGIDEHLRNVQLSDIATFGGQIINRYRRTDNASIINQEEFEIDREVIKMIFEELETCINGINDAVEGLPITLSFGKREIMILESSDRLIQTLMTYYQE